MKTIEEMAHEYAMQCIASSSSSLKTNQDIINHAWAYADAMQAEADKRKNQGTPQAILDAEKKPVSIKDDVFQKKGETCNHFSTTMFSGGVAECFNCGSTVNEDREIVECGR